MDGTCAWLRLLWFAQVVGPLCRTAGEGDVERCSEERITIEFRTTEELLGEPLRGPWEASGVPGAFLDEKEGRKWRRREFL